MSMHFLVDIFYGGMDYLVSVIWNVILFQLGVLLHRNKEVLNYFNWHKEDASNHLVDGSPTSNFDVSRTIATMGILLKIYAIAGIVIGLMQLTRYVLL